MDVTCVINAMTLDLFEQSLIDFLDPYSVGAQNQFVRRARIGHNGSEQPGIYTDSVFALRCDLYNGGTFVIGDWPRGWGTRLGTERPSRHR
jgi:hypothetical protein